GAVRAGSRRDLAVSPDACPGPCFADGSRRMRLPHPAFSLRPAKDRQLEVFPEAIDVAEADLAQPVALFLNRFQNVGRAVGAFHESPPNFFWTDVLAEFAPALVEMVCHRVVEHFFDERCGAGDRLRIKKQPALR